MFNLVKMNQNEYLEIFSDIISDYSKALVEIERVDTESAVELAKKEQGTVLYNGVKTPEHFLFKILAKDNEMVGYIWWKIDAINEVSFYMI